MHIIHVDVDTKEKKHDFEQKRDGREDIKADYSDGGCENEGYECVKDEGNNNKSDKNGSETSNDMNAISNERQINIYQVINILSLRKSKKRAAGLTQGYW